jgi:hypothetical protein
VPTQVSALSHFFGCFLRVSANFAGVTLAPFLSALTVFGLWGLKFDQHHISTHLDSIPPTLSTSTLAANPPRRREPKDHQRHREQKRRKRREKGKHTGKEQLKAQQERVNRSLESREASTRKSLLEPKKAVSASRHRRPSFLCVFSRFKWSSLSIDFMTAVAVVVFMMTASVSLSIR